MNPNATAKSLRALVVAFARMVGEEKKAFWVNPADLEPVEPICE